MWGCRHCYTWCGSTHSSEHDTRMPEHTGVCAGRAQKGEQKGAPSTLPFPSFDLCNARLVAPAIDCIWGAFGAWSDCSATCGGGEQHRHRIKTVVEANGGICVGGSRETNTCNTAACRMLCCSAAVTTLLCEQRRHREGWFKGQGLRAACAVWKYGTYRNILGQPLQGPPEHRA